MQRQMAERRNDMPIVFISGHGDIPTSVKAMKAGAVEFLTKPLVEGDVLDPFGRRSHAIAPPVKSRRRSTC